MCGGNLLIIPCSHVGHVFRKQTPYTFPGGTNKVIFRNNRRLVDVWTEDYKDYFHKVVPELNTVEAGDISPRLELKERLKCQSFKWYLTNIYPEAPIPHDFYHVGEIHNVGLNFCIDTMGRKSGEDAGASYCHGHGGNQVFEYSKQHQLAASNICLDSNGLLGSVGLRHCIPGSRSQQWDYDNEAR
jgi:polypeptide N-acetylgalactosaminyltransferase